MAKITMIIEDNKNGSVSVKSNPSIDELRKAKSQNEDTMAQVYAIYMYAAALKMSKDLDKAQEDTPLWLPGRG